MRIRDIISETAAHDQILWSAAKDILKPLIRDVKRDSGPALDQYNDGVAAGTLGQLSKNTPDEIKDVILVYAPGEMCEYFPINSTGERRTLIPEYNPAHRYILLGGTDTMYDPADVKPMISTLAHEMRHALDDTLSQGRFNRSAGRGASAYRGQNQIKDLPYERRPLELNAIYTQAVGEIMANVRATTNNKKLKDIIVQAFRNHPELLQAYSKPILNDPNFRRLINRAYNTAAERRAELQASKNES